jgi:hypothetical protein
MLDKNKSIVKKMVDLENSWNNFLDSRFLKDIDLLRWGQSHRVYKVGSKVLKIEKINDEKNPFNLGLKYESEVLNLLKKTSYNLNPKFIRIDNTWDVLELDFIDGKLLELDDNKRNLNLSTFLNIILGLIILSIKGIKYKQFRGRHILKSKENSIKFIDFGQSEITTSLKAFLYNFKLFGIVNKKIELGKLLYIFYFNFFKHKKNINILENARDRFLKNKNRLMYATSKSLKKNPGDLVAAKYLELMEFNLEEAVMLDKYAYLDILDIKFDKYGLSGNKNWGFIWHNVSKSTTFKNKVVFEIYCCQAALSSYSILHGAKRGFAFDSNKFLIKASKNLSKALRVSNIKFLLESDFKQLNQLIIKNNPNILFACSYRLDGVSIDDLMVLFKNVNEVFWDTNIQNINTDELKKNGFKLIKYIVKTGSKRVLVYLSKNT